MARDHVKISLMSYMFGTIQRMSEVDFFMRKIIALHCAKQERHNLLMYILSKSQFQQNFEIFKLIVDETEFFKTNENRDKFFQNVTSIQAIRNNFSHSLTELPENIDENENEAGFNFICSGKMKTKMEFETIPHTLKEMHENRDKAIEIGKVIKEMYHFMMKKNGSFSALANQNHFGGLP